MASNTTRRIARLAWIVPLLLLLLALDQAKVAFDLQRTFERGTPAAAEVLAYEDSDRVDVTYGYVSLRVPLPGGGVLTKQKMSLPTSLLPRVEGERTLDVRVRPGAAQEVVIAKLMPAHLLIAASQSGICFLGALLFGAGVFFWNRSLRRQEAAA